MKEIVEVLEGEIIEPGEVLYLLHMIRYGVFMEPIGYESIEAALVGCAYMVDDNWAAPVKLTTVDGEVIYDSPRALYEVLPF